MHWSIRSLLIELLPEYYKLHNQNERIDALTDRNFNNPKLLLGSVGLVFSEDNAEH